MTNRTHITHLLLVVTGFCLVVATCLGVLVRGDRRLHLDQRLLKWVQDWQGDLPTMLQRAGDAIGSTAGAIVLAAALLILCGLKQWRMEVTYLLLLVGLRLAGLLLKPVFQSPRPGEEDATRLQDYHHFGFPSGHSMTAAIAGATIILIAMHRTDRKRSKGLAITIGTAIPLLTGWSRIWAGAHWPSDVLGGWLYGVAFSVAAWVIAITRERRRGTR